MKKRPVEYICPEHVADLVRKETQYGGRYSCPVEGCTVVCWDGSTSTPADYETRQARMKAHDSFDRLWKSGMFNRKEAYRELARYLRIKKEDAHIGQFDKTTALKVCDFVKNILAKREKSEREEKC